MRIRSIALTAFAWLVAADVSAQTCLGRPSFSEGPYQASAAVSFTDGAQGFDGGFALGSEEVFGEAALAYTNLSDLDGSVTSFAAGAGASFAVNQGERIEACPVASVIISSGPDVEPADVTAVGLRVGGRLGLVAVESGNMEVVPTFGLDLAYDRVRAEVGDTEVTSRETYLIARAGVGFLFNRRIGIVPLLGIPLGLDGSDPEFSVVVSYSFGTR